MLGIEDLRLCCVGSDHRSIPGVDWIDPVVARASHVVIGRLSEDDTGMAKLAIATVGGNRDCVSNELFLEFLDSRERGLSMNGSQLVVGKDSVGSMVKIGMLVSFLVR